MITIVEFERVFKEYYRPLCLFSLRVTSNPQDSEDIVQQVFADVWAKIQEDTGIENLKLYLFRSVRNRSISFATRQSEVEATEQLTDTTDLSEEETIYEAERNARLWTAIEALPDRRRSIFLMAKRDGLKYQEIAERLCISVKTVENQMTKALKFLRNTAVRIYTFFFG